MQNLMLAILAALLLLLVQVFRRIDEMARTIRELKAEIDKQAEVARTSEKPRY